MNSLESVLCKLKACVRERKRAGQRESESDRRREAVGGREIETKREM